MRYAKTFLWTLSVLALGACTDDSGITTVGPPPSAASVRFINANVDTGAVNLRFPDRVENLPTFLGVNFRSTSGFYQGVGAGTRLTRLFPASSDINLASVLLVENNTNLAAGQRYTVVYAGRARAGAPAAEAHRLAVLEDPAASALPTPAANQIALQALHVAVGTGNVDVYIIPVDSAAAATPADFVTTNAGVLRNVPFLGRAANYVTVPVRPTTTGRLYRFVVTATGSTTPLFAATPAQPGAAPTASAGAQPGVQIGGSVMTIVVAPGATPGSRGAVATGSGANVNPTAFLIADKVLNQ